MKKVCLSIIIPVYNAQETISRCLDSVLSSSYKNFEIILINDGSTDISLQILREYEGKLPGIIKVYDQENQGVAKTRNSGIGYASGEYLMFVDNDDFVDEDYLEVYLNEIRSENCDIVIGGYRRVTDEKTFFRVKLQDTLWSRYIIMAPWAKIYRKDFVLENKLEFLDNNIGEDVYFNFLAINCTEKIKIIKYVGYNWFFNEKSVSNTSQKTLDSKLNVVYLLDSCLTSTIKRGKLSDEMKYYFLRYVIWYLLFIGRGSEKERMYLEYQNLFNWLRKNGIEKNKYSNFLAPKGEHLKNRIVVLVFLLIHRIKMTKLFFKLYSK